MCLVVCYECKPHAELEFSQWQMHVVNVTTRGRSYCALSIEERKRWETTTTRHKTGFRSTDECFSLSYSQLSIQAYVEACTNS